MRVLCGSLFVVSIGVSSPAFADDQLDSFVYNPDGTFYEKSLNKRSGLRGSGYAEAYTGFHYSVATGNTGNTYGLRGSYGKSVGTDWHLQFDGMYEQGKFPTADIDQLGGTIHLAKRFSEKLAVGAFVQMGLVGEENSSQRSYGFEAKATTNENTIFGRLGYGTVSYSGTDSSAFFAGIGGRTYLQDNVALEAEGRFTSEVAAAQVTGLVNLPDANSTISLTARYDATLDENFNDGVLSAIAAWRYSIGSQSLKQQEREGPIWSILR